MGGRWEGNVSGYLLVKLTGHSTSLEIREQESYLRVKNDPVVSVYNTRVGSDVVTKMGKVLWEEDSDALEEFVGHPGRIVQETAGHLVLSSKGECVAEIQVGVPEALDMVQWGRLSHGNLATGSPSTLPSIYRGKGLIYMCDVA